MLSEIEFGREIGIYLKKINKNGLLIIVGIIKLKTKNILLIKFKKKIIDLDQIFFR